MEGPRNAPTPREDHAQNKAALREQIFMQLVAKKIFKTFEEEMEDLDIPASVEEEIEQAFDALSTADKMAVLALPAELRPRVFARYVERIASGSITGAGVVQELLARAHEGHFTLGFHLSNAKIEPEKDGSWTVVGTEQDHRNADIPMAYYSLDYMNRYMSKPAQWLYAVRVATSDQYGHHQDNDGSWGRAPSLSVVEAVDLEHIEAKTDEKLKEIEGERERGDAVPASPQGQ
jgi:hypothetical protein